MAKSEKAPEADHGADALASARRVIRIEAEALEAAAERLGDNFSRAVETLFRCKGRIVVIGMGKSGQICRKIAATLASTGTSSLFVHAAEASHGDLGMLTRGDVCIAVSNSGTTREVVDLLPSMKRIRTPIIAITGGLDSPLAESADILLDSSIREEACPLGLAPTASTTVQLAIGDALAVALLERRGFSSDDFAKLHPGGALGRQLLRVGNVMRPAEEVPTVSRDTLMREALEVMTRGGLGVVAVLADESRLVGVVTDGDVRRGVLGIENFVDQSAERAMTPSPKTVSPRAFAAEALAAMEEFSITSLFVADSESGRLAGIVHLHDLLKADVA
jgi:arabinose-5-phosphate isomerase